MKIENNILIDVTEADIGKDGNFRIPEGVTKIDDHAFSWCKTLKKVYIPVSVEEIGEYAFYECSALREVYIPDSVTTIGDTAFGKCTSLQRVQISDSVTEIDRYAFCGCESLQEIKLPSSVTKIGDSVFFECNSLQEIEIPESVIRIDDYAFGRCESLNKIIWKGKTYHVKCIDGYCMNIRNRKTLHDMTILKCSYFPACNIVYVAEKDGYAAHGNSIRKAIEDLQFKIQSDLDLSEHTQRITKQGFMDANDYRLLTGACYEGTNRFLKLNNLTWENTMPVEKVLQLTKGQYGYDRFKDIAEQILKLM